jgi:hypothetical protein
VLGKPAARPAKTYAMPVAQPRLTTISGRRFADEKLNKDHKEFYRSRISRAWKSGTLLTANLRWPSSLILQRSWRSGIEPATSCIPFSSQLLYSNC